MSRSCRKSWSWEQRSGKNDIQLYSGKPYTRNVSVELGDLFFFFFKVSKTIIYWLTSVSWSTYSETLPVPIFHGVLLPNSSRKMWSTLQKNELYAVTEWGLWSKYQIKCSYHYLIVNIRKLLNLDYLIL